MNTHNRRKEMNIEGLLEKYFEGTTTCAEEQALRQFFTGKDVPKHLESYRPLFACIDEEIKRNLLSDQTTDDLSPIVNHHKTYHQTYIHSLYYLGAAAAACLLLFFVLRNDKKQIHSDNLPESYVVINGKRYNDPKLIRDKALEALETVSFSDKELKSQIIPDL